MLNLNKHFSSLEHSALLRFPKGLGLIVADEIKEIINDIYTPLKFTPQIQADTNSVKIENASISTLAEICMRTKTAKDIILELGSVRAMNKSELNHAINKAKWNIIIPQNSKIALRISTSNSKIYHSGIIEEAFKKNFEKIGLIITDKSSALTTLNVNLKNNFLNLGISLAGKTLNQRGYRDNLSHKAPLNECIAACLVRRCKYKNIHVPFAGSGTFGFEAIFYHANIAPCLFRDFALESLPFISMATIKHTRNKAKENINTKDINIIFSDNDPECILKLKEHAESLNKFVDVKLEIIEQDFFKQEAIKDQEISLLINPPYGERLKSSQKFFSDLGKKIHQAYSANKLNAVCICPKSDRLLESSKSGNKSIIKFINGGLSVDAAFFSYNI